jgi:hypothetical protein
MAESFSGSENPPDAVPLAPTARARRRQTVFAAGATIVMVAAIVWMADPKSVVGVGATIGWDGVGRLFIVYAVTQLFRAARLWIAIGADRRPGFGRLWAIASVHQFLNHVLPARLGEVGLPLLLRQFTAVGMAPAISLLVAVRLQEVHVLALIFVVAAVTFFASHPAGARGPIWVIGVLVILGISGLRITLPRLVNRAARLAMPTVGEASRFAHSRRRLGGFLLNLEKELAVPLTVRVRTLFFLVTGAVWASTFFFFRELLRLSGLDISFSETVLGSALANLSHVLPVNAFGSFGSLEAGWTLGFSLVGIETRTALATGLVMHVLVLVFLALMAGPSWLWLSMQRSPDRWGKHVQPR